MKRALIPLLVLFLTIPAQAEIKTETIEYKAGDTMLQGYLAYDDALEGKRPGVLVVHEWWGNNDYPRKRAEQLAQLGYVAFAMDMYGKDKLTDDPKQAAAWSGEIKNNPQLAGERATAGYDLLKKQPMVDPERIAAIGYCFGGTVVLNMARAGMDLDGVASFHGSLPKSDPKEIKNAKAKILVLNGADDTSVSAEEIENFKQEMRDAGADVRVINYPGAKHAFTNPNSDTRRMDNIAYNEKADKESWEAMKAFFSEIFSI